MYEFTNEHEAISDFHSFITRPISCWRLSVDDPNGAYRMDIGQRTTIARRDVRLCKTWNELLQCLHAHMEATGQHALSSCLGSIVSEVRTSRCVYKTARHAPSYAQEGIGGQQCHVFREVASNPPPFAGRQGDLSFACKCQPDLACQNLPFFLYLINANRLGRRPNMRSLIFVWQAAFAVATSQFAVGPL